MANTNIAASTHQRTTKKSRPDALSLLAENKIKPTASRLSVLRLFQSGGSFTPQDVYKCLASSQEELSLATTYRVLGDLVDFGILSRQRFEEGPSSYFLHNQVEDTEMLCSGCGGVIRIPGTKLSEALELVAHECGVTLEKFKVHFQGKCKKCARKKKTASH